MPEDDYDWLPREDVLHFEEISRARRRLPRARRRPPAPDRRRAAAPPRPADARAACWPRKPGLNDLALTTNGVLLADQIDALAAAGLRRITVSLDTLHADRFKALTRFDELARVHEGMAAATRVFGRAFKIDTVVISGVNDDELVDLIEYGKSMGAEVRFIEYMDVGGATHWSPDARRLAPGDARRGSSAHYGRDRRRSSKTARRRPIASRCRTARPSASSRRRPRRSAAAAIAAG